MATACGISAGLPQQPLQPTLTAYVSCRNEWREGAWVMDAIRSITQA